MKVAILTITDGANYGNRLQNYALQETIRSMGVEVETIRRKTFRDKSGINRIFEKAKIIIKRCFGKNYNYYYEQRRKIFQDFNNKYVSFSTEIIGNNIAPNNLSNKYDYFVCGSDQVWNARIPIVKEDLNNYLAMFANKEKRIAYAASFGTNDIPEEDRMLFRKQLNQFKVIGLREEAGMDIVRDLTGRTDAKVVLDPTMLLSSEQWNNIIQKPDFVKENVPYIVTYFLGGRSSKISQYIKNLANKSECIVYNLENEFKADNIDELEVYKAGPQEFVWLIKNAEYVLTDSFHATVFSILFHKKFCVFERKECEQGNNMNSRITTLLGYFGLEDWSDNIDNPTNIPMEYNGEYVDSVIRYKKQESVRFLKNALAIIDM